MKKKKEITIKTPSNDFSKLSTIQMESLYNFRLKEYNKNPTDENKRRLEAIKDALIKRGY